MATENTHFGAEAIANALSSCKSIFFIGIGGINMSSLAQISMKRGFRVGGSDRTESALTKRLAADGADVYYNHSSENVKGYDAVVYTVAISADNPEYVEAKKRGIPCFSRADYLGYVMTEYKRRIGVSGMHGKSTCTSMIAEALIRADADPTVLSGAVLPIMDGAYRVGGEENFVFEACEYMDSFLDFNPTVAVILNVEMDHVDYFKSMEQIRTSYARFADLTGEGGFAVYNADDPEVISSLEKYKGNKISFAVDADADYRATNIMSQNGKYSFDVYERGDKLCEVKLSVTGRHNVYNALAAFAACRLCGLDADSICRGLCCFCGAARRMEYKGMLNGAKLYDDYGHHPTEVKTTLLGAKGLCAEGGRLFCVFQPHTYSRTAELFDDFCHALDVADRVTVTDIYAARETDDLGVSGEKLAISIGDKAESISGFQDIARKLERELSKGDVAVIMGAGDVFKIFDQINGVEK